MPLYYMAFSGMNTKTISTTIDSSDAGMLMLQPVY
jgi:hypothetical protein